MKKLVIIINGTGGAGKDTLCEFAETAYAVKNISSITPIKEIAAQNGWNGEKDAKSRKFLADLKQLFTDYNELPFRYLMKEYDAFREGTDEILFVHIREPEEIEKFKKAVPGACVTLLVRRDTGAEQWGNESDDNVEKYQYDYYYDNNKELEETGKEFVLFLKRMLEEQA